MQAIEQVFPNTQHCFSYWHILKNAQSHLGTVNTSQTFQNMFMKGMQGSDTKMEPEESWAAMLHEYKLHDNFAWQVKVFGSFRTGLYLPTSDIDVSILLSYSISALNLMFLLCCMISWSIMFTW